MHILQKELYKKKNNKQKDFLSKLVPTIDKKLILGVKNPILRDIAKKYYKTNEKECMSYIKILPHKYLEEYILHSFILEQIKDYDLAFNYLKNKKLEPWTHNKAIQKACESYRITEKQKTELKKYKI